MPCRRCLPRLPTPIDLVAGPARGRTHCFGGVLVLLSAAHHPGLPVRSLGTMATPADFSQMPFAELPGIDVNSCGRYGQRARHGDPQAFRILMPTAGAMQYAVCAANAYQAPARGSSS